MNIIRQTVLFFLISLVITTTFGQNAGVGQWRDHLPFNSFIAVTESHDKIFGATPYAVLTYNKDDNSIERFSKINGLSDIGISDIRYSEELQTVVLAYTNTNIDLFKGNYIINVPDIKRKQILGNKVINKVSFRGDYAYFSCGFGIVVLDVVKEEIFDTWYIGPQGSQINVFDLAYNVKAIWNLYRFGNRDIGRESVGNCPGKILSGDGRIDLEQADLPQGADAGIGSAGAVDISSDSDEIRDGLDKLTLNGFPARLYLPPVIPAAIVLHGEFYIANSHAGYQSNFSAI